MKFIIKLDLNKAKLLRRSLSYKDPEKDILNGRVSENPNTLCPSVIQAPELAT
jgi:hypothetical protein